MTTEETIHRAYEAWSRRDVNALLKVVHPDAVARPILGANIGTSVYRGRQGLREWFHASTRSGRETFETIVTRIDERGDSAVLTVKVHARGRASGVVIDAELYHLVEIRNEMILRLHAFQDKDDAMEALEAT